MDYVLLDLERTILTGLTHYWRQSRLGYVQDIDNAGMFSEEEAMVIVKDDIENMTMPIPLVTIKKLGL